jgi:ABC-type lipoprotein export system ATPase subunit
MLSRIQALCYRCFRDLDINLPQYSVLVGGNGSGKSTLMDIPLLFSDILSSNNLVQAFLEPSPSTGNARTQRLQELIHRYKDKDDHFGFALEAPLPQHIVDTLDAPTLKRQFHTLRYEVRFQIFNEIELHVIDEFLWLLPETAAQDEPQHRIGSSPVPKSWRPIIEREPERPIRIRSKAKGNTLLLHLRPNELALKNLPLDETLFPAAVWLIRTLQAKTILYEPNISKLRQDSRLTPTKTILPDASNLPWMVLDLQEEHPRMFDSWVSHARTAIPHLKHITATRRENGLHAHLQVTYNTEHTVPSSSLSAGTLRILALTIPPYLSNPPSIVCLEEPTNGIHPQAIEPILQSLSSMHDSHVWLSTHSPSVLAHTHLSSIIIMQGNSNDGVQAVPGEQHPRLHDWDGEVDLGTLFAEGALE